MSNPAASAAHSTDFPNSNAGSTVWLGSGASAPAIERTISREPTEMCGCGA